MGTKKIRAHTISIHLMNYDADDNFNLQGRYHVIIIFFAGNVHLMIKINSFFNLRI